MVKETEAQLVKKGQRPTKSLMAPTATTPIKVDRVSCLLKVPNFRFRMLKMLEVDV